jgi:hypothetical protein
MKEASESIVRSNNEPFPPNARRVDPASEVTGPRIDEARNGSRRAAICLAGILVGAGLLYYLALKPDRLGEYHDDSVYVTTAKALADGLGYRIISLPNEPLQTKYPPLHPLLLSLVWRINPEFPANIVWMMSLSCICAIGFLALTYYYLTRSGYASEWQALVVVGLTAVNLRTIILATSTASEMLYSLIAVAVLYLAERNERAERKWAGDLVVGTVIGLGFLARIAGISLLIALGIYFAIRRRWSRGVLVLGVGEAFVFGWLLWCYVNSGEPQGSYSAYYTSYLGDILAAGADARAATGDSVVTILLKVIARNSLGLIVLSIPVLCSGLNGLGLWRFEGQVWFAITILLLFFVLIVIAVGFARASRKRFGFLHSYIVSYLALFVIWPYSTYDRFLVPILPFLLLFLVTEAQRITLPAKRVFSAHSDSVRRVSAVVVGLTMALGSGAVLFNYWGGISWALSSVSLRKVASPPVQDVEAIHWISANTNPSDVLVCLRDPVYYLYTGRKAVVPFKEESIVEDRQSSLDEKVKKIRVLLHESRCRYLILNWMDLSVMDKASLYDRGYKELIESNPREFVRVFEGDEWPTVIYRVEENGGS